MAINYTKKYRVIRPFGDIGLSDVGTVITIVNDRRAKYLIQSRYVEEILTDTDDGINITQLYKIAKSTAKNLELDGVNAGTLREALKHETRSSIVKAIEERLAKLQDS